MTSPTTPSNPTVDPYEKFQIVRNVDGTITRLVKFPETPASSDLNHPTPVLSKDIPINQSKNTWVRIFLPRHVLDNPPSSKLPLIVFFYGGGFVLAGPAYTAFHDLCVNLANEVPAVIVSVKYRLAPEHRLPAAYDDSMESLNWIRTSEDDWLREYADVSNCFLMGTSSGGNIAYTAGLRAAVEVDKLEPLKIRGLILHHPFFGGAERTQSEIRLMNDEWFPVCATDLLWELSLPVGVDRDHEYCNPTVGGGSELLSKIRLLGWRVLVTGWDGDQLIDRQMELAKMLKDKGVQVVGHFGVGEYHGVEVKDPSKAKPFLMVVKSFISS